LSLPVNLYDAERNYKRVRDKWFGGRIDDPSKSR
jgi:hypothetical protein